MTKLKYLLLPALIYIIAGCVQTERIDYTKTLQQLTAAINELSDTINQLEGRVAALEESSDSSESAILNKICKDAFYSQIPGSIQRCGRYYRAVADVTVTDHPTLIYDLEGELVVSCGGLKPQSEEEQLRCRQMLGEKVMCNIVRTCNKGAPQSIARLCTTQDEIPLSTPDGYQIDFRGPAVSITSCNDGAIWQVKEDPSLTEVGILYFDANGKLIDVCQFLERPAGCERFRNISCSQANICL